MQLTYIRYAGAGALGHRLGSTSKELVAALLPLTTHKRYRVRIAALGAIRDVVHQVRQLGELSWNPLAITGSCSAECRALLTVRLPQH